MPPGEAQAWYHKLTRECNQQDDDQILDTNTAYICSIHAHTLLMLRNASLQDLSPGRMGSIVCGMVFLSTRHKWNSNLLGQPGLSAFDGWRIPEHQIYEAIHTLRRKLVLRMRQVGQSELDAVMDSVRARPRLTSLPFLPSPPLHLHLLLPTHPLPVPPFPARHARDCRAKSKIGVSSTQVVRVSASSGSTVPSDGEVASRWAYVAGERNSGRFALHSNRSKPSTATKPNKQGSGESASPPLATARRLSSEAEGILTMADEQLAVEVDVQVKPPFLQG